MNKIEIQITQPVFYILFVLSIKKSHGYEIMKKVTEYSNNMISLGPGTLYTAIKRLVDEGYIKEDSNDTRRKYYVITNKGRDVISSELERISNTIGIAKKHNLLSIKYE